MPTRPRISLVLLVAVLLLAATLRLLVGAGALAWPESAGVWELRSARVALGAVVGVALAVAGVLMQSLLRNPLASPDILGASSGAALAILFAAYLGGGTAELTSLGGLAWQGAPAIAGATGAMAVVLMLSRRRGLIDPGSLILVGVVVAIMCSAGVMLLQQLMPPSPGGVTLLLVGSLQDTVPPWTLGLCAAITLAVTTAAALRGRALDAAALDDHEARSVGVRLGRLRLEVFAGAGLLTALAVVLAGPVGFVGLVCPHVVRRLIGNRGGGHRGLHGPLVIGSALAGAALVVGADALAKSITTPSGRLPIGVLTALLGGPVLISMLRAGGREP